METENIEILLVEDDEQILTTTAQSLEKLGFEILTARNGQQALDIFEDRLQKGNPIKVVITDMLMPKINGMDLIKEIYKKKCQTAFIVCSAYKELKEDLEAFPCIRRIHIKPINLKDIIQDLIVIFMKREWLLVPTQTFEQQRIHKKAYEAIQKIITHLI